MNPVELLIQSMREQALENNLEFDDDAAKQALNYANQTVTTTKFSGLTPAQEERLEKFVEECAEGIQAAMKILHHGYSSVDPTAANPLTNKRTLEKEIADIKNSIRLLALGGDLDSNFIEVHQDVKWYKMPKYLHYNKFLFETGEDE